MGNYIKLIARKPVQDMALNRNLLNQERRSKNLINDGRSHLLGPRNGLRPFILPKAANSLRA